jgi:hypothetical protein
MAIGIVNPDTSRIDDRDQLLIEYFKSVVLRPNDEYYGLRTDITVLITEISVDLDQKLAAKL